jgi:hypothetical protein
VSELAGVTPKDIARWGEPKVRERALAAAPVDYPAPMFHWKERADAAIAAWRDAGRAAE